MLERIKDYFRTRAEEKVRALIVKYKFKVISNITVTSDILQYNDLYRGRAILEGNEIRTVSDRQSFVYNPSNTTYVSR